MLFLSFSTQINFVMCLKCSPSAQMRVGGLKMQDQKNQDRKMEDQQPEADYGM